MTPVKSGMRLTQKFGRRDARQLAEVLDEMRLIEIAARHRHVGAAHGIRDARAVEQAHRVLEAQDARDGFRRGADLLVELRDEMLAAAAQFLGEAADLDLPVRAPQLHPRPAHAR